MNADAKTTTECKCANWIEIWSASNFILKSRTGQMGGRKTENRRTKNIHGNFHSLIFNFVLRFVRHCLFAAHRVLRRMWNTSIRSGIIDDIDFWIWIYMRARFGSIYMPPHSPSSSETTFSQNDFSMDFPFKAIWFVCEPRIFDVCVFLSNDVAAFGIQRLQFCELWCRFSRPIHHPNIYFYWFFLPEMSSGPRIIT